MSLADIRTQLKAIIESVDGIGKVHDYDRWTTDWNRFLSFFKTEDNKINGWIITRSWAKEKVHAATSVNIRTHRIIIKGYYGLKDSAGSEKAFQDLIESVCDALRKNNDLNGSCLSADPPQVAKIYHRPFGGILVHACNIVLSVDEYLQYS
jgi:hypothetical protein